MSYFRLLPDIDYPNPLSNRVSDASTTKIKNIFRRVKLRDDLQNNLTLFDKYEIRIGQRPDTVAQEVYGDSELDWLVLVSNNITNIRNEWPLSEQELYDFAIEKYGSNLNNIRFYETTEVRDSEGRLIYPKDIIVNADFSIPDPDSNGGVLSPIQSVTNYDFEVRENNKKRSIFLLRSQYIQSAIDDIREELSYDQSSQFINKSLIKSDNSRLTQD